MGITDTAKWKAIYNDGTSLSEMDPDGGDQHTFKEIDMEKITSFQLVNPQGIAVCEVKLDKDKRLIYTRRNRMTTGQLYKVEGNTRIPIPTKHFERIIILGWQKTVNGVNTKAIFYLLPDGRIEMDDDWRDDATHSKVDMPRFDKYKAEGYSGSNDSAFGNKK